MVYRFIITKISKINTVTNITNNIGLDTKFGAYFCSRDILC